MMNAHSNSWKKCFSLEQYLELCVHGEARKKSGRRRIFEEEEDDGLDSTKTGGLFHSLSFFASATVAASLTAMNVMMD
jgi:hypothetical protein